jgi:Icc-related predicted phosphoesterase
VRIVATSDLHGTLPEIPPCDLLLIAGDVTPVWNHERNFQALWLRSKFSDWLNSVPADEIVGVGGNHDFELAESPFLSYDLPWRYLDNEAVTISGLKIWGSPLSPTFGNWAFMRDDRGLAEEWAKIPEDVDILMVHGPPFGHRDVTTFYTEHPKHVGSMSLANRLYYEDFPNLQPYDWVDPPTSVGSIHIHEDDDSKPIRRKPKIPFGFQAPQTKVSNRARKRAARTRRTSRPN